MESATVCRLPLGIQNACLIDVIPPYRNPKPLAIASTWATASANCCMPSGILSPYSVMLSRWGCNVMDVLFSPTLSPFRSLLSPARARSKDVGYWSLDAIVCEASGKLSCALWNGETEVEEEVRGPSFWGFGFRALACLSARVMRFVGGCSSIDELRSLWGCSWSWVDGNDTSSLSGFFTPSRQCVSWSVWSMQSAGWLGGSIRRRLGAFLGGTAAVRGEVEITVV